MTRLIDGDLLADYIREIDMPFEQKTTVLCVINTMPSIEPKQEWISVKDDMPKERESIFARFYGTDKWRTGMFRTTSDDVIACVEYEDGSRLVKVLHTISGEWHMSGIPGSGIVTHWAKMPEPPAKEN